MSLDLATYERPALRSLYEDTYVIVISHNFGI